MRQALSSILSVILLLPAFLKDINADWPTYAGDIRRSNETDEQLTFPLKAAWRYTCSQPPRRAWPEPVKNLNRLDFDYAPHPVVAAGFVYFGSSADDTVRALELETGEERWHFITGGPVRFAPQIEKGKAYFGSDDGFVTCVDAGTGKIIWKFDAAPTDERLLGNGRMISRWPIRTGVLVDSGVVYFAAGMWAAEGVYVYAIDAANGKIIWCNDTSGTVGLMGAHGTFSLTGVNPQGYLLATDEVLLVPSGRTAPAGYDRQTGKLLYHDPGYKNNGFGGTWLTIRGDRFLAYTKSFYSSLAVRAASVETGKLLKTIFRVPQHSVFYKNKQYSLYDGKTSVVIATNGVYARKAFGLVKAADSLIVGQDGFVEVTSLNGSKIHWRSVLKGKIRGIAVSDGRLVVTTEKGEIACFAPEALLTNVQTLKHKALNHQHPAAQPNEADSRTIQQLKTSGVDRGYALVLGDNDASLSLALTAKTRLHVILALSDQQAVEKLREQLLVSTSLYGSRIHVHYVSPGVRMPFAQYFANTVIVVGGKPGFPADELNRLLRPRGGILLFAGEGVKSVRGKLPGALDWDSEKLIERRVKWPLRPIWFGGPGPARMFSRKYRNSTLAFAAGRYFVMGESHLIAVDAYNGLELWSKPIPRLRSLNADNENVYLLIPSGEDGKGTAAVLLDPSTGREKKKIENLEEIPERFRRWTKPVMDGRVIHSPRVHPLTGRNMPKVWMKAFGCSGYASSATSIFTRSGSLGIYDFEDDSGMRNFGGLRPGCGYSNIAAMGLWIVNEGSSSCECSYSYQTSLAFAPAERRLTEDWAVFYDWKVDSLVRQAALNFGAPGDRRDERGSLWVGFPRPATTELKYPKRPGNFSWMNIPGVPQQIMPLAIQVPLKLEAFDGFGPHRFNAERISIEGADRPWVYTSCFRGIRKATLKLNFLKPVVFQSMQKPPALDGKIGDAEWGEPQVTLADSKTKVFLRYDKENLYIASFRPPIINRLGKASGWNKKMTKDDSQVYHDDSWEIFLSDAKAEKVVHLGLSAGGARFDALAATPIRENRRWNGKWQSSVSADTTGFVTESIIPMETISGAGLDYKILVINFQISRRHNVGEALMYLGFHGRNRCENFSPVGFDEPPAQQTRSFTVKLHFAELDDIPARKRIFDVKIQENVVLKDFDVVSEADGVRKAVVKTFPGIQALNSLRIEFIPSDANRALDSVPILNGMEVYDEAYVMDAGKD